MTSTSDRARHGAQATLTAWRAHPRLLLALRTALAAGIAWLLVQPMGSVADDYPYYAPLGAVVAMSTAVLASLRAAVEAVAAIALGAAVALGVDQLPVPAAAGLPLTVAVGVLLAGLRWFHTMGSWVPVAALFVLIVGGTRPESYVLAYAGLTALGAAVAIAVNFALPQLPLMPAALAQARLREEVANQLDALVEGLTADAVLDAHDWAGLCRALQPQARHAQELVDEAMRARRGNWRAGRWARVAEREYAEARVLQHVTNRVDDVVALVTDPQASFHADTPAAGRLRSTIADALGALARMLRFGDLGSEDLGSAEPVLDAAAAVGRLRAEVADAAAEDPEHFLAAAAIAVNLHRAVHG